MAKNKKDLLDKFYTKDEIAKQCVEWVTNLFPFSKFNLVIEPSAGGGAFLPYLPSGSLAIDIAPEHPNVIEQDFLNFVAIENNWLVIGNPPFGNNASLAKAFFNHSATFAEVIAFVLPKSFRKLSVQNNLDLNFSLVFDSDLPDDSFTLNGESYSVTTCFQIWKRTKIKRPKKKLDTNHKDWEWTTSDKADFSLRRVGVLAGKINKDLNFSASSNYFLKANIEPELLFNRLTELYERLNLAAKNTAGNPSLSKTELVEIYNAEIYR